MSSSFIVVKNKLSWHVYKWHTTKRMALLFSGWWISTTHWRPVKIQNWSAYCNGASDTITTAGNTKVVLAQETRNTAGKTSSCKKLIVVRPLYRMRMSIYSNIMLWLQSSFGYALLCSVEYSIAMGIHNIYLSYMLIIPIELCASEINTFLQW